MKKVFVFVLCTVLLCTFMGCDKKQEPEQPQPQEQKTDSTSTPTTPTDPVDPLMGNIERPSWTVPSSYDYTSSMSAVIRVVTINGQKINDNILNESDLVAAFAGDTCLGIASPIDGLFFLYIAGVNDQMVNLKYYSTHYKNIFEAKEAFPFVNDAHLGSVAEPFAPAFVVVK